ncbi:MAG: metallophosphoesterase [Lentisphaeria bacterium]|nr:metallophosphoesterase [Lentisphaeria bacterium]
MNAANYQKNFIENNAAVIKQLNSADIVQIEFAEKWQFTLNIPDKKIVREFELCNDKPFDLDKLIGEKGKFGFEGTVINEFFAADNGIAQIGIGCDWFFEAECNGEIYYSTWEKGNGDGFFSPQNHIFLFPVKRGKNILKIKVKRGSYTWNFACGKVDFQGIALPEIEVGPYLTNIDSGQIEVRFSSCGKVGAGVEFRRKNNPENSEICWDACDGIIRKSQFHCVKLNDLQGGETYQYRIVILDPDESANLIYPEKDKFYSFTMPSANQNEFSFVFMADLQFEPELMKQKFQELANAADLKSCDFLLWGGDIGNSFSHPNLLGGILQEFAETYGHRIPLAAVRGNHELMGNNPEKFRELFGELYGVFRYGDCAFLKLDTFSEYPDTERDNYLLAKDFLDKEKKDIAGMLLSPKWREAKRRIIFAHGALYSRDGGGVDKAARFLVDEYFRGISPKSKLDLYLAGHTHIYSRSTPLSDQIYYWDKSEIKSSLGGKNYLFPTLTVAGPGKNQPSDCSVLRVDVKKNKMILSSFSSDGQCFDKVEILIK